MHPQEKQIASRVKLKIGENIISQLSIFPFLFNKVFA